MVTVLALQELEVEHGPAGSQDEHLVASATSLVCSDLSYVGDCM